MAIKITYGDKSQGQSSGFPTNQKWTFQDSNEVKTVVNSHADDIDALTVSVNLKVEGIYTRLNWGDNSSTIRGYLEYNNVTDTVKLFRKVGANFVEFGELGSSITGDNFVANILGSGLLYQTPTGDRKNLITSQFDESALIGNELGSAIITGNTLLTYKAGTFFNRFVGNSAVDQTPTAAAVTAFGKSVYKYQFDFEAPFSAVFTHVYVTTDVTTPGGVLMIAAYNLSLSGDEDDPLSSNVPISDFFSDNPQGEVITAGVSSEYKIKLTEDFNQIAGQKMVVKFWSTTPLVFLGGDVTVPGIGLQLHPKYDFQLTQLDDGGDLLKKLGSTLETVLDASSFVNQQPSGTDTPLQIEFGAAQGTVSDPVMIDALGTITFNEGGLYFVYLDIEFGRTGAAGTAMLKARAEINALTNGFVISASISNANTRTPLAISDTLDVSAADELKYFLLRDSSGNNSGGLFANTTTLAGWNDSPSARIEIKRLV